MKDTVLIFADEAIWGGNKKDIGKLKAMVTEEYVMIEAKGKDVITGGK
jgi:phage/plasmid-associated DNA primase